MECTIDLDEFREALLVFRKLGTGNSTPSILDSVRLDASDGSITATAADLDTTLRVKLPGEVREEGTIVLDGILATKKFVNKQRKRCDCATFRDDPESDIGWVQIETPDGEFRRKGHPVADYPDVAEPAEPENRNRVERFTEACGDLIEYVCTDDARADLCGAYFTGEHDAMIATDGHRLRKTPVDPIPESCDETIIPRMAVKITDYLATTRSVHGVASVGFEENYHTICLGNWTITAKAIEGTFPDFTQVLPNDPETARFELDPNEFGELADVVRPTLSSKTKNARFTVEADKVRLYTSDPDVGESEVTISETVHRSNDGLKFGVNLDYVEDAVDDLGRHFDTVIVEAVDTLSPVQLHGGDGEHIAIVMPMRM